MSGKSKLFSDAIAEAKELKKTALANAKLAMTESFSPRIQTMISQKLNEMEELEENEMSLEELVNSLEEENIEETTDIVDTLDIPEEEFESEEVEGEVEGEEEVGEITVDELRDIIRAVNAELVGNEETEENEFETEENEFETEENEEETLAEEALEEMGNGTMREPSDSAASGAEELVKLIKAAVAKAPELASKFMAALQDAGAAAGTAMRNEEVLEEAKKTILSQSKLLKETNLLNAKLIFVNKLFKSKNLTESQKTNVINALDRTKTVKEAENTFQTLKESLSGSTLSRKPLKEHVSFASKPAGGMVNMNSKPNIVEDDMVARMKKLAGI